MVRFTTPRSSPRSPPSSSRPESSYQGRQARKARDDTDRPQIIVDADYTGRFTTNIVVRNIGHGTAKNITFDFSAPLQSTSGYDVTELPYFKHGINFMAPRTDLPAVWDSYQNVVENLRAKGLTGASRSPRSTKTATGSRTRPSGP